MAQLQTAEAGGHHSVGLEELRIADIGLSQYYYILGGPCPSSLCKLVVIIEGKMS